MELDLEQIVYGDEQPTTELVVPPEERETAVDDDGWVYDPNTGEVLGHAELLERFTVDSDDAADWVLKLRSQLEGEILGIEAQLKAVSEMLLAVRNAKYRRLSWWEWRFAADLIKFARTKIAGTKAKTAWFTWGKVQFRKTAGTNEIVDPAAAVEWMRTWNPKGIKVTESVGIKKVLETIELIAQTTGEEPERPGWLKSTGEGENVTISTGIEIKAIEKRDTK